MMKQLSILSLMGLTIASGAIPSAAQDAATCSTTVKAEAVIAGASSGNTLVVAVAQSVPADPSSCVPAYCQASADKPQDVKVAVGAGISEAYSKLLSDGNDDEAVNLLTGACSAACDEVVLTAFAASQSSTVSGLCETALGGLLGGAGGAPASAVAFGGSTGAGGGSAASGN